MANWTLPLLERIEEAESLCSQGFMVETSVVRRLYEAANALASIEPLVKAMVVLPGKAPDTLMIGSGLQCRFCGAAGRFAGEIRHTGACGYRAAREVMGWNIEAEEEAEHG